MFISNPNKRVDGSQFETGLPEKEKLATNANDKSLAMTSNQFHNKQPGWNLMTDSTDLLIWYFVKRINRNRPKA